MALSISLLAPIPPPLERMPLPPGLRASSVSSANRLRNKSELMQRKKPLTPSAAGMGTSTPAAAAKDVQRNISVTATFSNEQDGGSSAAIAPTASMMPSGPSNRQSKKACRFFMSGRCRKGVACTFGHEAESQSRRTDNTEQPASSTRMDESTLLPSSSVEAPTTDSSWRRSKAASNAGKGQLFRVAVRKVSGGNEAENGGTRAGGSAGGRPCEATPSAATHCDRAGAVSTPSTAAAPMPLSVTARRASWGSRVECNDPVEDELPYLPWAKGSPPVSEGSPLISESIVDEAEGAAVLSPSGSTGVATVEEASAAQRTAEMWATPVISVPPVSKAAEWDTPIAVEEATKDVAEVEASEMVSEASSQKDMISNIAPSSTAVAHSRGCWRVPRRARKQPESSDPQPETSDPQPETLTLHQVHILLLKNMYGALEREALRTQQRLS